jgi:hypothetical protein
MRVLNLGLIGLWGFECADGQSHVSQNTYGGVRAAFNPEVYLDAMWGATTGVQGARMLLRGQFPLVKLGIIKTFVGGESNIACGNSTNPDSVKFYAMAQASLTDFAPLLSSLGLSSVAGN